MVDAVNLALASNGTQWANPPISPSTAPDVVSSVNLRVAKACSTTSTWVANMALSNTGSWWDNGSFTTAAASGLSGASVTAQTGDCLIFRVYHQGVSAYQEVAALYRPDEIAALVSLITVINAWNTVGVSTRTWTPGTYEP